MGDEAVIRRTALSEAAIEAGLLDLADAAIVALDAAAVDPDLGDDDMEPGCDDDGWVNGEAVRIIAWCRCCGQQQVAHEPEFIA